MSSTRTTSGPPPTNGARRGGALLAVLWLTAALSAIAFSLATSVRGETERASTSVDSVRSYYLAMGAVQRALLYAEWGPPYYLPGTPRMLLQFPEGEADVEIIPEASKVDINSASVEELFRLLVALGTGEPRARTIALAIVDWRTALGAEGAGALDGYYLSLSPSFRPSHTSFEETEELMRVQGMTPELYYGSYERDSEGRLRPRGALKDCVTVFGGNGQYDVNTAEPAVFVSAGLPPQLASAIVAARRLAPFQNQDQLRALIQGAPGAERLAVGGGRMFTVRATARIRLQDGKLSDQRRSVAATVKAGVLSSDLAYQPVRWYDNAWVQ